MAEALKPDQQSSFASAAAAAARSADQLRKVAQGKRDAAVTSPEQDHWVKNLNTAKGSSDWSGREQNQINRPWWDGQ